MLTGYRILCTHNRCTRPAVYKIAARWSDGTIEELKTYALCCAECLPEAFRRAVAKNASCRRARGETLEPPGIYLLSPGSRDRELQRRPDLETQLTESSQS